MGFLYILLSLIILRPTYVFIKKLLISDNIYCHLYAIILPLSLSAFHLYVFHFDFIPLLNIDTTNDDFLHYASFVLAYSCCIPYIIARRKHNT